jgi:hypothetical protein
MFDFTFIISRGVSEVFDVTIIAKDEESAKKKLNRIILEDFSYKLRIIVPHKMNSD